MRRLALAAALALAGLAATALPGDDAPPPAPSAVPAATARAEPLALGAQVPADLVVSPVPVSDDAEARPDVPLASLGGDAAKPLVVLFWSARCPVCRRYAPAVRALAKDLEGRARLVLVFPNATESDADVRAAIDALGAALPAARDRRQEAAARLAAVVTPTALVFDGTGALRYRGPIDDDRRARRRDAVEHLRVAVESVVATKPVEVPEPRAFGSSVRVARK